VAVAVVVLFIELEPLMVVVVVDKNLKKNLKKKIYYFL
jgi:hypothetical protein